MKEILEILKARASAPNVPYALATVVRVEGSSYRRPGARMLISVTGRVAGSVSGGCLERDVISKGLQVLLSGVPELVSYDTTDDDDLAFGSSLGCQGRIEIWLEALLPGRSWPLEQVVNRVLQSRKPCALATIYAGTGDGISLVGRCFDSGGMPPDLLQAQEELQTQMEEVLRTRKAQFVPCEVPGLRVEMLIERMAPPISLFIFGAGHDAPPFIRMARELGHHVTVIDRRAEFADPLRLPEADAVLHAKPHQVLRQISFPELSALILMNHHYETDRDLLGQLHDAPVAYLGMLGPRKRTMKILQELGENGLIFSQEELMKKLHAPAGLDLGSENPEQIALSILAEIQATLADRRAAPLKHKSAPIHGPDDRPQTVGGVPCPTLASSF